MRSQTESAETTTYVVGLIGAGIGASLSPALHEREARAARLRLRVPAARPRRARPRAARRSARWCARRATPGCAGSTSRTRASSSSSPSSTSCPPRRPRSARSTRSSSTAAGSVGHNTDATGFAEAFGAGCRARDRPRRRCSAPAARARPSPTRCWRSARGELTVVDVDARPRARELAAALGARAAGRATSGALADADGLVHATPTGMAAYPGTRGAAGAAATRASGSPRSSTCRSRPSCCRTRAARGCRTLDGGGDGRAAGRGLARAVHRRCGPTASACSRTSRADRRRPAGRVVRRSIATVCLSGTLEEKLAAAARGRLRRGRAVRARPDRLAAHARAGPRRAARRSAWRSRSTSRSATSRRCRTTASPPTCAARSASSR